MRWHQKLTPPQQVQVDIEFFFYPAQQPMLEKPKPKPTVAARAGSHVIAMQSPSQPMHQAAIEVVASALVLRGAPRHTLSSRTRSVDDI